jgi:pimeloyl-ACP methyl ester carboxylesterase
VSAYTLDILAADIVALSNALGADRIYLVGHDWGAVTGWWVAARHPERLKRVVLISGPHPEAWARQALRSPRQALRSAYIAFFQLPWIPEAALGARGFAWLKSAMRRSTRARSVDPGTLARYVSAWERTGSLRAILNYYRALRRLKTQAPVMRIKPPVLVICGDHDRFLGRAVMEASAELCDDGRLITIVGASHWLHWEDPERVTAEILGFLREA